MNLKAGNRDYAGSMAEAMEKAFKEELAKGQPKADDQMKILFIAVAQGVIRHLVANSDAFKVTVSSPQTDDINYLANIKITSTNT